MPILYYDAGPVSNVLGRVPLMPWFLRGNSMSTIMHCFVNLQRGKFPYCCADVVKESGRKGSNVYEVNPGMVVALWEGRGSSLGGASLVWGFCQCLRLRYGQWL